jgi:hypothetical protein
MYTLYMHTVRTYVETVNPRQQRHHNHNDNNNNHNAKQTAATDTRPTTNLIAFPHGRYLPVTVEPIRVIEIQYATRRFGFIVESFPKTST